MKLHHATISHFQPNTLRNIKAVLKGRHKGQEITIIERKKYEVVYTVGDKKIVT